jgi:hypothetical protein
MIYIPVVNISTLGFSSSLGVVIKKGTLLVLASGGSGLSSLSGDGSRGNRL